MPFGSAIFSFWLCELRNERCDSILRDVVEGPPGAKTHPDLVVDILLFLEQSNDTVIHGSYALLRNLDLLQINLAPFLVELTEVGYSQTKQSNGLPELLCFQVVVLDHADKRLPELFNLPCGGF